MATTIDRAFVKQFEREVHEAYQRMGSKLRPTVRSKSNIQGSSTTFQKVGKGTATTKAMVQIEDRRDGSVEFLVVG